MPNHILKRILLSFKPFWVYFGIVVFALIILNVVSTFSPLLFGKSVDAIISKDIPLTIKLFLTSFALYVFSRIVIDFFIEYIEVKFIDEKVMEKLSLDSLQKMFGFSIGQHTNEHSGVSQSIVNKGQNALSSLMFLMFFELLPTTIQILVTTIILFVFDYRIAFVALIFVFIYVFISLNRNKKIFPQIEAIRKNSQEQSRIQTELFRNAPLVIAESKEESAYNDYKEKRGVFTNFAINTWLNYIKVFFAHRTVVIIGQYAALGFGVYLILIGEHSAGMLVTLYSWLGSIFGFLQRLMNSSRRVLFNVTEIKKYFSLLDIEPDIDINEGGVQIENFTGKIAFEKVSFVYPFRKSQKEEEGDTKQKELKDTLTHVSFTIPAKAKVGFVGLSGSGKSTIINLIRRYYDTTSGEILIDNTPIKDIDLKWLRTQIGSVDQNIRLFDSSVKENILFGAAGEVSEEVLQKVIKSASLESFIEKLDHGLDTVIGESGVKISGGERQRIGIARALIKNPKIIIFDEATSALDSVNEKIIHEAIKESAKDRTTIIVAHRLSTIKDADIIFVVKDGKIAGQGTHKELEQNSADYRELIKNQFFTE